MFEQTSMYNRNACSMLDTHNICTSYAIHFDMLSYILHKCGQYSYFCVFDLTNYWSCQILFVVVLWVGFFKNGKWVAIMFEMAVWSRRFIYLHENDTKCIFPLFRQEYILVDFRVLEKGNRRKVLLKCIDH